MIGRVMRLPLVPVRSRNVSSSSTSFFSIRHALPPTLSPFYLFLLSSLSLTGLLVSRLDFSSSSATSVLIGSATRPHLQCTHAQPHVKPPDVRARIDAGAGGGGRCACESFIRAPRGNVRGSVRREPTRASSSHRWDVAIEHLSNESNSVTRHPNNSYSNVLSLSLSLPLFTLHTDRLPKEFRVHLVSPSEASYTRREFSRGIGTVTRHEGLRPCSETPRDTL